MGKVLCIISRRFSVSHPSKFEGANLMEAEFEGANLKGAKNLVVYQLSKVKTLYKAQLD